MQLAKSPVLHETALAAIETIKREREVNGYRPLTSTDRRWYADQIAAIENGKPYYGENQVNYLSRRCWELTEAIYAMQKQNETNPIPCINIEIERLTVNNNINFAFVLVA